MPSITTAQEATLLQLQYTADSCGLRRSYLRDAPSRPQEDGGHRGPSIDSLIKPVDPVKRPNIDWYPSFSVYQERVARLAELAADRPSAVPEGFPEKINGPRVWTGSEFDDPDKYLVHLSKTDLAEIKDALDHFKNMPGDNGPDQVNHKTFPLPTLGPTLVAVSKQLHFGTGFAVIRGLNPNDYSPLDNILVYLGITSYIAEIRGCQDYDGRMLVHIKDIEKNLPEATGRPSPYTSRAQPFHTDRCDILAMYALDVAVAGGESLLASAGKIYNEIAASRPDVIHTLADDGWIFDEFRKTPSWHTRPLLHNFKAQGPGFCYSRRPLTGAPYAPHTPGVPAMTEIQAEALDMVHFTARKHQLAIKLQRGDIEVFNNFALFHARNGFVDDRSSTRHMIRLWLKSKDFAWETPEPLLKSSWEIYGSSEYRAIGKWDVHRAPPINRKLTRRMSCS